jgi:hypothetical protein
LFLSGWVQGWVQPYGRRGRVFFGGADVGSSSFGDRPSFGGVVCGEEVALRDDVLAQVVGETFHEPASAGRRRCLRRSPLLGADYGLVEINALYRLSPAF